MSGRLTDAVDDAVVAWRKAGGTRRILARDASTWTNADETRWLGWLDPSESAGHLGEWQALASAVKSDGIAHVLVLGMGGSSLWPLTVARTFPRRAGWPELHVLDSTDPVEVLKVERSVDLARTLVIVASKSGSTLEPNLFMERLLARVGDAVGKDQAAQRFVAITDPGSSLERSAREAGFRAVVPGIPSIGGRFSALSAFGMLPAALAGAPVDDMLAHARAAHSACVADAGGGTVSRAVRLGCALGALARLGRDKITLVASPGLAAVGAWIEQLVAESTGKHGRGLVPIDGEDLAEPQRYGADRVFVAMTLASESGFAHRPDADAREAQLAVLAEAGHPVIRLELSEPAAVAGLAWDWELATAVAGAHLGIHPFDQPDVEAAKNASRALMEAWERDGSLPSDAPLAESGSLRLHADARNASALVDAARGEHGVPALLAAHVARAGEGDYFATLAFTPESDAIRGSLRRLRLAVRDARRVATSVGFGPRFLHSTGQLHKGGPPSGVFLQVTCDDGEPCAVPGRSYDFGVVKAAQAGGDLAVLAERGRRALRVHVTGDTTSGIEELASAVADACATTRRA